MFWSTGDSQFEFHDGSAVDFSLPQEESTTSNETQANSTTPRPPKPSYSCVAYSKSKGTFVKTTCDKMRLRGICRQKPGGNMYCTCCCL